MAGDWIKIDCTTPDKPEVVSMAAFLKIDQDAVVGKCLRLWIWANQQSVDGNALSVTDSFLDRLTYCPGFSAALRHVGWLTGRDCHLSIPNFDRHNGQPAKTRALTKDRVGKNRSPAECNAASVTKPLPEKRREDYRSLSVSDDFGEDVVIPEKMQTDDVIAKARFWFQHLDVMAPDKIPERNSPQMQAFWAEAAKAGPDEFVRQVDHCVARGWKNLRKIDEPKPNGRKERNAHRTKTAQSREDANSDAFETLFATIGREELSIASGATAEALFDEKSGQPHHASA